MAQTPVVEGDALKGARLAASQCGGCHAGTSAPPPSGGVQADIPSFQEIARLPGQSAERIDSMLMIPSHPMPVIQLSRAERTDLAAFILSLKDE